uniref:Uncharacterized protein n=1 Tax=Anguilla anguilla TaxID=7936 RepID=A0A0E9S0M7_ANGAN
MLMPADCSKVKNPAFKCAFKMKI